MSLVIERPVRYISSTAQDQICDGGAANVLHDLSRSEIMQCGLNSIDNFQFSRKLLDGSKCPICFIRMQESALVSHRTWELDIGFSSQNAETNGTLRQEMNQKLDVIREIRW